VSSVCQSVLTPHFVPTTDSCTATSPRLTR
jgi:hypothetical protein